MTIRYFGYEPCEPCQRSTPRKKNGDCVVCCTKRRKARRKLKADSIGTRLVRYGAVMEIADNLRSAYVRAAAPGCAMCGRELFPNELQWAHGFSRKNKPRLRYHDDNAWALCAACHFQHTPAGPEWYQWMELQLGPSRYRGLLLADLVAPRITLDLIQIVIVVDQARIRQLPSGERRDWALWREAKILEDYVRLGVRAA